MKKLFAFILSLSLILCLFASCGEDDAKQGRVYFLNFKPEQDKAWQALADKYTKETGIEVKVVTAAQGTYEQTLIAEIDKDEAPTLFQVNGPIGLETWKDYCLDLSDTDVYEELLSDDFALKSKGKVYGIAYVYEAFGLITNKDLLKKAGYTLDDIKSFNDLKKVAEDITSRKDTLGFSAFTSSGLSSSSSWRFSGHLANLPLFYQLRDKGTTTQPEKISSKYIDNFKALWDLYTNNSTIEKSTITSDQNDASAEFAAGKAVFFQNGTWEYENIKKIGDKNIGFLPIYFGVDDQKQGLCSGTENYWCVNNTSSEKDIEETLDFMEWVVTSEIGTKALADDMGFVSPFKKAKDVDNVLSQIMAEYVDKGNYSVTWAFNLTPNVDVWRSNLVDALSAYTAGKGDWSAVEKSFVNGWEEQYKASKR